MAKGMPNPNVLKKNPDEQELKRLKEQYHSYYQKHRTVLLDGYFSGRPLQDLVADKLKALGKDVSLCSPQSLGGHSRWVKEKVKKTFARVLYLRYRIDEKMSREGANARLLDDFGSPTARDKGKSAIRKMTEKAMIDR